ncbi:MAG: redox-sensing transcriptional repressor Rex, partial [Paramuribaculum sp.]|nr:redox-sensing transcriptional repressor Rex [Paramuribaculum sp.]
MTTETIPTHKSDGETARALPSGPTLKRLPWYLACVSLLRSKGIKNVSSTAIAREIDVDPSQTAKDLSVLRLKGKTRIGYDVIALESALKDFLGFTSSHVAVIMGVGSLGAALLADRGLHR